MHCYLLKQREFEVQTLYSPSKDGTQENRPGREAKPSSAGSCPGLFAFSHSVWDHPGTAEAGEGQAGKPWTESAGPWIAPNFTKDHEQGQ